MNTVVNKNITERAKNALFLNGKHATVGGKRGLVLNEMLFGLAPKNIFGALSSIKRQVLNMPEKVEMILLRTDRIHVALGIKGRDGEIRSICRPFALENDPEGVKKLVVDTIMSLYKVAEIQQKLNDRQLYLEKSALAKEEGTRKKMENAARFMLKELPFEIPPYDRVLGKFLFPELEKMWLEASETRRGGAAAAAVTAVEKTNMLQEAAVGGIPTETAAVSEMVELAADQISKVLDTEGSEISKENLGLSSKPAAKLVLTDGREISIQEQLHQEQCTVTLTGDGITYTQDINLG